MLKKTLTWIIWKTLPSCKDVTVIVSRSLETNLSWREKLTMKIHLWSCIACHRYFSQLKFMGRVFQLQEENLKNGKSVPTLTSEAAERLKDVLKSSKFLLVFIVMNSL